MYRQHKPSVHYSPSYIAQTEKRYSIPIYQRLFEWQEDSIVMLLEDLKQAHKMGQKGYYIGMLTSTQNNELVDGQQRFTMIILLGLVLNHKADYSAWKKFLLFQGQLRLHFSARPKDNEMLYSLISTNNIQSENSRIYEAYILIQNFIERAYCTREKVTEFAEYVYNNLCFFISELPKSYKAKDLNRYFERMNTTGKNLEQHEILKVKMLSLLDCDIDQYMSLWNKLADMDTLLISKDDITRKQQAIKADVPTVISLQLIEGVNDGLEKGILSIGEISPLPSAPKPNSHNRTETQGIFTFPHLLLQVLYRQLEQKPNVENFFRTSELLAVFDKYLLNKDELSQCDKLLQIKAFLNNLLKARLALDICFIRHSGEGYSLDMNEEESNSVLKTLLMFQSMLYVSSSNLTHYRWFGWLMDEVEMYGIPDSKLFYNHLKTYTNKLYNLPSLKQLSYGAERYWFWRLDFHIWLHRDRLFQKGNALEVVNRYVFRRNRSVEHVAPQHPKQKSEFQWEDTDKDATLRDSFGNLAMISQGLNSALNNQIYELKKAHVEAHLNESMTGSIESLKLLMLFLKYKKWGKASIEEHGKEMYELLLEAYNTSE